MDRPRFGNNNNNNKTTNYNMKVNNIKRQAGLTLIEVTLVIAVLLGLISVLFIGVAAYKQGSDRAKCVLNIATVQKAVRSFQNMYDKRNGDVLAKTDIAGPGKMIEVEPTCPDPDGSYTWQTAIPDAGIACVDCSLAGTKDHVPASVSGW